MFIKKRFFIFAVFVLLVFVMLTYQATHGGLDTSNLAFLNYPVKLFEQGLSGAVKGISNLFNGGDDISRRLLKQTQKTAQENNQYLETKYENERLKSLLELKSQRTDYITTAEVFARDPTNWFQVLWINKGAKDGISKNMIAVTPLGVVGKIHRVFGDRASIIQITDVSSSVAVRIQSSRAEGILEGSGGSKCYLEYVPQEVEVAIGDMLITSGLDGLYPEGLQIGVIKSVTKKNGEFFQSIEVLPSQDFKTVEEVAVLKR